MMGNSRQTNSQLKFRGILKNWAVPIVCGLIFIFLLKCVFFIGFVSSVSMEPSIRENTFIIGTRLIGEPARDDVVIFNHSGRLLIKRIYAAPGDRIINGREIIYVPYCCYYMIGDNAEESVDSRYWEDPFVYKENIIAKLF